MNERLRVKLTSSVETPGRTYRPGTTIFLDRTLALGLLADGRAEPIGQEARARKPGEMLVKLNIILTDVLRGYFQPGDVASLPEHQARRLIDAGHAEAIPITLADLVE